MFSFCSTSRGWPSRRHQSPYLWRCAIGAEVRGAEPSAPSSKKVGYSPDYVFLLQYITRMAESSAPTTISVAPSHQRRGHHTIHSADPLLIATTISPRITTAISPSRQRRGNINHHHHFAEDHHYHFAESSAPRQYKSPPPFRRAVTADANTMGRDVTIDHPHHSAAPSVPRPTPWAESLLSITTTIGPSRQHRGQHHGPSHLY